MNQKEKACSALTAVFPNKKSIADFIKDSEGRKRLESFIDLAARHGLIDTPTHEAFEAFIDVNSRPPFNDVPEDLTMADLIENRRKYFNTRLSNSALTDKINTLLSNHHIKLPQLSSAMFTRLKTQAANTPRRRDALRSFAFWIGHERGAMGNIWHYGTLKGLCRDNTGKTACSPYGIRIAFSINSRGNIIGQDIITWMKHAIKKAFRARNDLFSNGHPPKIKNYDLMTFMVDLPNSDPSAMPSAYGNTLKTAVAIAHQIAIQWMMSGFSTHNRFFSIGLAAGNFEEVNNQLQTILNAKLPEDPVIRLTDYTRQCVVINQIKIIMNHKPEEIELFSGEAFKVWWMIELSGMIYWDLVPGIINENSIDKDYINFWSIKRRLTVSGEVNPLQHNDAISFFVKFPHHPMLGAEVVRALICKKKFSESLEIINALLRVTPLHQNSRIMKMMLYKFLGVEAPDYYLSVMMFTMAEKEAVYILENLSQIGEDFYYEYALLKLAQLSTAIKALRRHGGNVLQIMDLRLEAKGLIALVKQAEEIVMQGVTVSSPTVERISYLSLCVQVLKCVLFENIKDDGRIEGRLICPNEKIKQHIFGVIFSQYQQVLALDASDLNHAMGFINEVIRYYDDVIALEAFKPANYFLLAVFFWDILPVRNVQIIRETLNMLEDAITSVKTLALANKPVYCTANLSGQFVTADQFISQMDAIIKEIEKRYQKAAELEKMDPAAVIGPADDDLVLMTYHV